MALAINTPYADGDTVTHTNLNALVTEAGDGAATFNALQGNHDFVVKSVGNANMLKVDGTNNRVVIGGSAPGDSVYNSSACTVTGSSSHTILFVENTSSTSTDDATVTIKANGNATVHLYDATATTDRGRYNVASLNGNLQFGSISDDGTVGLVLMNLTRNSDATKAIINIANVPTSASGLSTGDIYSDSGTLKIA